MNNLLSFKKLIKKFHLDVINNVKTLNDPDKIVDIIVSNISISLSQKQEILEIINTEERLK